MIVEIEHIYKEDNVSRKKRFVIDYKCDKTFSNQASLLFIYPGHELNQNVVSGNETIITIT